MYINIARFGRFVMASLLLIAPALTARSEVYRDYPDGNREVVSDYSEVVLPDLPAAPRTRRATSKLYIEYAASYQTEHYECWGETGLSDQWQGVTRSDVANAGVVRRGRVFYLVGTEALSDPDLFEILAPAHPDEDRQPVAHWTVAVEGERLAVTIPADAPIGDYRLEYADQFCTAYVIFDIYQKAGSLSDRQFASWAYDDSTYGSGGYDYLNYLLYGPGPATDWTHTADTIYAFRGGEADRHDGVFGERLVELGASIHGKGARTELEAGRHIYSIVGQRLTWTSGGAFSGLSNGYYNTFDRVFNGEGVMSSDVLHTALELDTVTAERAALGRGRVDLLPDEYVIDWGQCMNFASNTSALARAIGIAARPCYAVRTRGWSTSFHVWAELLVGETDLDFPGWSTPWWKFDASDERREVDRTHLEGSIAPLRMDGWSDFVHNTLNQDDCDIQGGQFFARWDNNLAKCDEAANHSAIILKPNTTAQPAPDGSMIWYDFRPPHCPWMIVDTWTTYNGTGDAGIPGVEADNDGYALNLLMNLDGGGAFNLANTETNDDLPFLEEGVETPGVVGGLGTNFCLVDISNGEAVTVRVAKGAYRDGFGVRLYGIIDEAPHVRGLEPMGEYQSQDGALVINSIPTGASHLVIMAVGEDIGDERFDNQVWHEYSLLLEREASPELVTLSPAHGAHVSGDVKIRAVLDADSAEIYLDGELAFSQSTVEDGHLVLTHAWDTSTLTHWSEHEIRIIGSKSGAALERFANVIVRKPEIVFFDGFEHADAQSWSFTKSGPSTLGDWVTATPREALTSANFPFVVSQPGAPADGLQCLFTGLNPDGSAANDDVDDGAVTAEIHDINIAGRDSLTLSFDLWWFNRDVGEDDQDYFKCELSTNNGINWTTVYELSSDTPSHEWKNIELDITSLTSGHNNLALRLSASDGPGEGNLVEAAIDNITLHANQITSQPSIFITY